MLRGLSTVNFLADDLAAAQAWYTDVLGIEAYFVREVQGAPAYVEFRIGDYLHELGIIDGRFAQGSREPGGALVYWHVDDVQGLRPTALERGDGLRGTGRARARLRHRLGRRSVRQLARRDVQPALPRGPRAACLTMSRPAHKVGA
jgi:catechol 2,3-dioxygenase-like lactoylglutathione lyase family enzyme